MPELSPRRQRRGPAEELDLVGCNAVDVLGPEAAEVVGTVSPDRHQVVAKDDQQLRHAVRGTNGADRHERVGGNGDHSTETAQSREAERSARTQAGSSSLRLIAKLEGPRPPPGEGQCCLPLSEGLTETWEAEVAAIVLVTGWAGPVSPRTRRLDLRRLSVRRPTSRARRSEKRIAFARARVTVVVGVHRRLDATCRSRAIGSCDHSASSGFAAGLCSSGERSKCGRPWIRGEEGSV